MGQKAEDLASLALEQDFYQEVRQSRTYSFKDFMTYMANFLREKYKTNKKFTVAEIKEYFNKLDYGHKLAEYFKTTVYNNGTSYYNATTISSDMITSIKPYCFYTNKQFTCQGGIFPNCTEVGPYAFYGYPGKGMHNCNFHFPKLEIVNDHTFYCSSPRTNCVIPKDATSFAKVKEVKDYGFYQAFDCSSFSSYFDERGLCFPSLTKVGPYAFYGNDYLKKNHVPLSQITEIGEYAFYYCFSSGISEEDLANCEILGNNAFSCRCTTAQEDTLYLPKCREFGKLNFSNYYQFHTLDLPAVEKIADQAYDERYYINTLKGKDGMEIGKRAFHNSSNLSTVIGKPKKIDELGFNGCRDLANIDLSILEYVGEGGLAACQSLTSYNINWNIIKHIDDEAFINGSVENYVTFDLPTEIPNLEYLGKHPFDRITTQSTLSMPKLKVVTFERKYSSHENYDLSTLEILSIPSVEQLTPPSAACNAINLTTIIGAPLELLDGFSGCPNLQHIDTSRLTSLPFRCFSGTKITEFIGGNNLTTIDSGALDYCDELVTVQCDNVTTITCFDHCAKLEKIIFPNLQTITAYSSFYQCPSLKEIHTPKIQSIGHSYFESPVLEIVDWSEITEVPTGAEISSSQVYTNNLNIGNKFYLIVPEEMKDVINSSYMNAYSRFYELISPEEYEILFPNEGGEE